MCQHVKYSHLRKNECSILEDGEVEAVDGSEDLFFEFFVKGSSKGQFGDGGIVQADTFGNLILGLHGRDSGQVSGVDRELEVGAGEGVVCLGGHDHTKVAMATTTTHGGNGTGISIDFLCE